MPRVLVMAAHRRCGSGPVEASFSKGPANRRCRHIPTEFFGDIFERHQSSTLRGLDKPNQLLQLAGRKMTRSPGSFAWRCATGTGDLD